jgi:hypothetical protein
MSVAAKSGSAAAAAAKNHCAIYYKGTVHFNILQESTIPPNTALSINIWIDTEYIKLLNYITAKIPGTEILKVNCAASALFTLGLVNTDEYVIETQQEQVSKYLKKEGYGRSSLEIMQAVCNTYNPSTSHEYIDLSIQLRPNEATFRARFIALCKYFIKPGMGTYIQYGAGKTTHFVSLIHMDDTIYLYDYQQQYCIPEEGIIDVIIKQSMPGSFRLVDTGPVYEGYSYISSDIEIETLYILIPVSNGGPIYSGAMNQSLILHRYIAFSNGLHARSRDIIDLIKESLNEEVAARFPAGPKSEDFTPEVLMQLAEMILTENGIGHEIEPEFSPQITYPETQLLQIVDARTRHLNADPAAKSAEGARLFQHDYAASRPMATWDTLRDILKMDIIDLIKRGVESAVSKKGHNAPMWQGGRRLEPLRLEPLRLEPLRLGRTRKERPRRRAPPSAGPNPRPSRT